MGDKARLRRITLAVRFRYFFSAKEIRDYIVRYRKSMIDAREQYDMDIAAIGRGEKVVVPALTDSEGVVVKWRVVPAGKAE